MKLDTKELPSYSVYGPDRADDGWYFAAGPYPSKRAARAKGIDATEDTWGQQICGWIGQFVAVGVSLALASLAALGVTVTMIAAVRAIIGWL